MSMNLYEWPTPNPAPKPTYHWGLDKSYKIIPVRLNEFIWISHLVKYAWIGREIALLAHHMCLVDDTDNPKMWTQYILCESILMYYFNDINK